MYFWFCGDIFVIELVKFFYFDFYLPLTISLLLKIASYTCKLVIWEDLDWCLHFFPRFQREFTQGVKPNWIIARIDHAKLLE